LQLIGAEPVLQIFIGNIGHSCTKEDIRAFAEKIAPVHKIHIPLPRSESAKNPGYAFVMYKSRVAAAEAIEQMGDSTMPSAPNRKLVCS
jgi:RNA recognition motif-containing protein